MDWTRFYSEIKDWQNAIGALVGFAGLIVAALFNAHLNRKRDQQLRSDEAKAVAASLYEEIVQLRERLARMANSIGRRYFDHGIGRHRAEPYDPHFLKQVALPQLVIYPALASKVGLLPAKMALNIVRFYARLDETKTRLGWLPNDTTRPFTYGPSWVLDPAISAITGITETLREIEAFVAINEQAPTPSLEKAVEAQEHEELLSQG